METLILTANEKNVLVMTALKYSDERIARKIHCEVSSVENYRKSTFDKVRVLMEDDDIRMTCATALAVAMIQGEVKCIDLLRALNERKKP